MKVIFRAAMLSAAFLGMAACSDERQETANQAAATGSEAVTGSNAPTTAAVAFPRGARIVEEDGVTFRVDPDGTRVRLGDTDSRIVIEDNVRFRVDPDGTRVRIAPDGAELQVDDNIRATIDERGPALEVNTIR